MIKRNKVAILYVSLCHSLFWNTLKSMINRVHWNQRANRNSLSGSIVKQAVIYSEAVLRRRYQIKELMEGYVIQLARL